MPLLRQGRLAQTHDRHKVLGVSSVIDTPSFVQPEYGWILVLAYGWYEIRFGRISEYLEKLDDKLTSTIIVIRAIVRTNPQVNTEKVDDYLVDNGHEPSDFITDIAADGGAELDKCNEDKQ